jgi:hypothetical protein
MMISRAFLENSLPPSFGEPLIITMLSLYICS